MIRLAVLLLAVLPALAQSPEFAPKMSTPELKGEGQCQTMHAVNSTSLRSKASHNCNGGTRLQLGSIATLLTSSRPSIQDAMSSLSPASSPRNSTPISREESHSPTDGVGVSLSQILDSPYTSAFPAALESESHRLVMLRRPPPHVAVSVMTALAPMATTAASIRRPSEPPADCRFMQGWIDSQPDPQMAELYVMTATRFARDESVRLKSMECRGDWIAGWRAAGGLPEQYFLDNGIEIPRENVTHIFEHVVRDCQACVNVAVAYDGVQERVGTFSPADCSTECTIMIDAPLVQGAVRVRWY